MTSTTRKIEAGPTIVTSGTTPQGSTETLASPLPPDFVGADLDKAVDIALDTVLESYPSLEPNKGELRESFQKLISGASTEERVREDLLAGTGKVELKFSLVQNFYIAGDMYSGQDVGFMGSGMRIEDSEINQVWEEVRQTYDDSAISNQLQQLAAKLDELADNPDQISDAALVEKAAREAEEGKGSRVIGLLSRVSKWVLDVSKDVGTEIATKLIQKQLGIED